MKVINTIISTVTLVAWGQLCEHQWKGEYADHYVEGVPFLQAKDIIEPPSLEIQPLIINGPPSNRIDIIFLGDGYTESDKDKFFDDAMNLAENITSGHAFADVLPLMNFWAGFSSSAQSGIGLNGQPKDTVYGIYRTGKELRMVASSRPSVIRSACQSTEACDYPVVLSNDPLYGGMGGNSSSVNNGPSILRHEMGHTLIEVGEEYDGGFNYSGVNSAKDNISVPWIHWYTDRSPDVKISRANMPLQAYPWTLLNVSQGWSHNFTSAGTYGSYVVHFSLSGIPATGDLEIDMDGTKLNWEVKTGLGLDRWIYKIGIDKPLTAGPHALRFTLLNKAMQGTAQLCSVAVIEQRQEDQFESKAGYYRLYRTFDAMKQTTYRPTNELYIMRDMHSEDFCSVCMEGLWLRLLGRPISFLDNITQTRQQDGTTKVMLQLLPLADLRKVPATHKEAFSITWFDKRTGRLLSE